jgi:polyphosphate kinase
MMDKPHFYNRDLSWLSFNERVMDEAANDSLPILERLRFLSIFSSNLDEFYRVRMPVLHALKKIGEDDGAPVDAAEQENILQQATTKINGQLNKFGGILRGQLIPQLKDQGVYLLYGDPFPDIVRKQTTDYFLSEVLAFLQPLDLGASKKFFPGNNVLYFIVHLLDENNIEKVMMLNIPSDELSRFTTVKTLTETYIVFLDDIIRYNLDKVFKGTIRGCYSIKITRDAELDLADDYPGDISEEIEKQLKKRDFGFATRFLHEAGIPLRLLQLVIQQFQLQSAIVTEGGRYHNLKDFFSLNINLPGGNYEPWPAIHPAKISDDVSLLTQVKAGEILINTPYQSYNTILRFFNEAAINPDVTEIYITLYRVASNSKIVHALISAAESGKKVTVMVELKARFDEANNLQWAKKMIKAGVEIVYSITALKVHAKVALVKTKASSRTVYSGLLSTGNFNEQTAKFYTDHILFTANPDMLREMELLFIFLSKRKRPGPNDQINFNFLLVAQFNLQTRFLALIDREIAFAEQGLPAAITIKMNNLEEKVLISKLYEASQAGVKISLIIRGICCLIPGVNGMSENISIKRIVDRYLEHGRTYIFNNNGQPEVFLGSADWMNRNIYNRIEVCFPIYDNALKAEIMDIIDLQLADNVQAVWLDESLNNIKIETASPAVQSQLEIFKMLKPIG